jgi:hypothetical protein
MTRAVHIARRTLGGKFSAPTDRVDVGDGNLEVVRAANVDVEEGTLEKKVVDIPTVKRVGFKGVSGTERCELEQAANGHTKTWRCRMFLGFEGISVGKKNLIGNYRYCGKGRLGCQLNPSIVLPDQVHNLIFFFSDRDKQSIAILDFDRC